MEDLKMEISGVGLKFYQNNVGTVKSTKNVNIRRDWGDSYVLRNCSVLITVGATLNEYRADSWPVGYF